MPREMAQGANPKADLSDLHFIHFPVFGEVYLSAISVIFPGIRCQSIHFASQTLSESVTQWISCRKGRFQDEF